MKDGDIFYLNQYPCKARINKNNTCWFDFIEPYSLTTSSILNPCDLKQIIRDLLGVDSLGQYSKEIIHNLDRSINFFDFDYTSCPTIIGEESFNKYIKLLQSELIAYEIKKNIL